MKQLKKHQVVLVSILLILFIVLFFLSTIVKNYLNKNGEELIGRKVHLNGLNINYLRVAIKASDFVLYEENSKDTFAGFNELHINFDPWKLIRNEYSFSTIALDSLYAYIVQDDQSFNFDDLIPPSDTLKSAKKDTLNQNPLRFSIYNIKLSRGKIDFYDKKIDNRLLMDDLDLNLPKIAWDSEQSEVGAEFEFGEKGSVFLGAEVNHQTQRYNIAIRMNNMELEPISNYVEQYIDAEGISGLFHADIKIDGHMEQTNDIVVSGSTSIDSFRLWQPNDKNVLIWRSSEIQFDSLDLGNNYFHISKIKLDQPILTAELHKDMSNIEQLLLPLTAVDSTQIDTSKTAISNDSIQVRYALDSLQIIDGQLAFSDHTLNRPFKYDLKNIDVKITGINESAENVPIDFNINMNDQGQLIGKTSFSLVDPLDISLEAKISKLRLMSFSPYTEYYITRPITQGDFNYDLSIDMDRKRMTNNNVIKINELEFGGKTKDTTGINAPIRLALYLLKDPQDVISIDLPVEGDPNEPDFSVRRIIWKSFMNFLIKTAASPFNALANLVSVQPEELENIPMNYAQDSLAIEQRSTLDKIAELLNTKPDLFFSFTQETSPEKEKDVLAINLAKQQMLHNKLKPESEADIIEYKQKLVELTNTDESFINFINKNVNGADTLELRLACRQLIGEAELQDEFVKLLDNRNLLIENYLTQTHQVDSASIEVHTSDLRNIPEELHSSNYNVEVSIR
ncbi:DUF748 domain-containing protein [Carboxylicivirga sp. N1Y90]|uniref:DUF748 domain-containing protein n=1 Tax=Carboxylicivirga fragile TaxID=3417571 RepID=UPI003D355B33|nr:DUF748 domain-containing protein [Marinilabiliaceae bacterium N1Y90]